MIRNLDRPVLMPIEMQQVSPAALKATGVWFCNQGVVVVAGGVAEGAGATGGVAGGVTGVAV